LCRKVVVFRLDLDVAAGGVVVRKREVPTPVVSGRAEAEQEIREWVELLRLRGQPLNRLFEGFQA
jgi:hypothetical protein